MKTTNLADFLAYVRTTSNRSLITRKIHKYIEIGHFRISRLGRPTAVWTIFCRVDPITGDIYNVSDTRPKSNIGDSTGWSRVILDQ